MSDAEWILTFDDGPLPADVVDATGVSEEELLRPLDRILDVLESHSGGSIAAVFFLRGPAYPWPVPPPDSVFQAGVDRILGRGHAVGLHAYRHDPDLWWNWLLRGSEIREDLDRCRAYFEPMAGQPITVFRPPYGQGGLPAYLWSQEHNVKHHLMDVDPEDWKHHHDALHRRWVDEPQAHLQHMLNLLPARMWFHTLWPGANDILLHVSERTAQLLPELIQKIVDTTRQLGKEPRFVLPPEYMGLG